MEESGSRAGCLRLPQPKESAAVAHLLPASRPPSQRIVPRQSRGTMQSILKKFDQNFIIRFIFQLLYQLYNLKKSGAWKRRRRRHGLQPFSPLRCTGQCPVEPRTMSWGVYSILFMNGVGRREGAFWVMTMSTAAWLRVRR